MTPEARMERKLAAILSADVKGYSRLMGEDEEATIRTLTAYRQLMATLIEQHRGRVVDSPGDNLLAEFASVVDAVQCGVTIQQELKGKNAAVPAPRQMEFRLGINVGDVVVEGTRLYGDGVNIAARLEGLAEPGGLCISGTVLDHVKNKLALRYEDLGEQAVKNIAEPVRVWRVVMDEAAAALAEQAGRRPLDSAQDREAQKRPVSAAYRTRAVALNDSWHWNHIHLGNVYLYQQQYDQALAEMKQGVALGPTEAGTYAALAQVLSYMGRTEEALEAAAQALRLKSELADDYLAGVGTAYAVAGRYEAARAPLQRFLSRYPNRLDVHLMLAAVYSELGQAAEAQAEAAEVLRLNPQFSLAVHRQRMPIKDPAMLERHLAALRKAGLK